ncbi:LysR family transcriptional regulator [Nonomuraea sediminis]|uniref:LysR family transcriptional regulator n=1 Tax=Nonomuraea sediminis TaxID=2835864 RepID=UPI001BDDAA36|nr:LysR family transcriptional regulator [Nonomuraea sediminis]
MDLDLAQVRAFVVTAGRLHFGQAAAELYLTQQALSKRIARLEEVLGTRLFDRSGHAVELTAAGRRFLEPAVETLRAADRAVAAAVHDDRPLRLDVWSHLYGPQRMVRLLVELEPELDLALGMRSDVAAAITGLRRDELDAGFGWAPAGPLPDGLARRLVRLEPVAAVMSQDSPLAAAGRLRPEDLRAGELWFPADAARLEFLRLFAEEFGLPHAFGGVNLGMEANLDHLRATPGHYILLPAEAPVAAGLRRVPLVGPTPLYGWSLLWREGERHPLLPLLLDAVGRAVRANGWLDYDPARHWMPTAES